MDYKKLIIINLAFLIILGKIMQFLFNKMQKNLNFIKIQENLILNKIFAFYNNSNLEEYYNNYNNGSRDKSSNETLLELQIFYKNSENILKKYLEDENLIYKKENVNEIIEIVVKINTINEFVMRTKKRKLKFFICIILLIILVNIIATRKFMSWENLNKIKDKMRNIQKKIEKIPTEDKNLNSYSEIELKQKKNN